MAKSSWFIGFLQKLCNLFFLIKIISLFFGHSQELVSTKSGNRLKKRLCIAVVVLIVIGLGIAALIHFGAIKPTGAKGAVDRLAGGYVTNFNSF